MLLICFIYKYQYTTVAWLADIISYHSDLLHLVPNSPDAKVFEGFQKSAKTNSSTPVSVSSGAEKGSSSSAQEKSGAVSTITKAHHLFYSILPLPLLFLV